MAEYIPKSAVLAEIERRKEEEVSYDGNGGFASYVDHNHYITLDSLQDFINTLEVKEVDLDAFGILAEHLLACEAHAVSPKYRDEELDLLEQLKKLREEL